MLPKFMILDSLLKSSARRAVLGSCLALSPLLAVVAAKADSSLKSSADPGAPGVMQAGPQTNPPQNDGKAAKSLSFAKQIALACKIYAADNDGAFPPTLDALVPSYFSADNLKKMLVSAFAPNEPVGFTYHPGLTDASDPKAILLEDKFAPTASGQKIVVYVDGTGEIKK